MPERRRRRERLPTQQCQAKAKSTGERCRLRQVGSVCRFHGGRAPQVMAAAERRAALMRAINDGALSGEDVRPPEVMLRDLLGRLDAAVQRSGWPGDLDLTQNVVRLLTAVYGAQRLAEMAAAAGGAAARVEVGDAAGLLLRVVDELVGALEDDVEHRGRLLEWAHVEVRRALADAAAGEGLYVRSPPRKPVREPEPAPGAARGRDGVWAPAGAGSASSSSVAPVGDAAPTDEADIVDAELVEDEEEASVAAGSEQPAPVGAGARGAHRGGTSPVVAAYARAREPWREGGGGW